MKIVKCDWCGSQLSEQTAEKALKMPVLSYWYGAQQHRDICYDCVKRIDALGDAIQEESRITKKLPDLGYNPITPLADLPPRNPQHMARPKDESIHKPSRLAVWLRQQFQH